MTTEQFNEMWSIFRELGQSALIMSHYDLAEQTVVEEPYLWKQFLMEQEVSDWIKTEVNMLQETELKKMIKNIGAANSVGRAQLINVLSKLNETSDTKTGPIFIYTYVPLSKQQTQAENIETLTQDPFLR